MGKAEPEGGILVIGGGDHRNAVGIAGDRHLGREPQHRDPAVDLRQRRAEIEIRPAAEEQDEQRGDRPDMRRINTMTPSRRQAGTHSSTVSGAPDKWHPGLRRDGD